MTKIEFAQKSYYDVTDGVYRWLSNRHVVPADILVEMDLDDTTLQRCIRVRDDELRAFLTEYRAQHKNGPSPEERAEARAAHGPGVKLVDVFTGYEWTT